MGLDIGYPARRSTQRQLKITYIDFAILNSHLNRRKYITVKQSYV